MFETFLRALDLDPADMAPRLVLADWLSECGDPKLAALEDGFRATVACGLVPWRFKISQNWGFWDRRYGASFDLPASCLLDEDWFRAVATSRHVQDYGGIRCTPERNDRYGPRHLLKALAVAFPKLPEGRRLELLAGTESHLTQEASR